MRFVLGVIAVDRLESGVVSAFNNRIVAKTAFNIVNVVLIFLIGSASRRHFLRWQNIFQSDLDYNHDRLIQR